MNTNKFYYKMRGLYIKTFSWEYWPVWVVYFPVSFYFLYLSIKARSFFFFSASNPTIETGGMFFESKWKIFQLVPKEYYPTTILVEGVEDIVSIEQRMKFSGIAFPIIAKPDRGERGWAVKKITSIEELGTYKAALNVSFLIQSYVNYPVEMSVFYYRHPLQKKGMVTSVTLKKLLTITGDGQSSIDKLVRKNDRSFLQYRKLVQQDKIDFTHVPEKGEQVVLVPYGNHVLGATFLNYNHIIDAELTDTIDSISQRIDGFYFGRYDLRCASIEDLKMGENFSILEVNGAGAEPAHIYEPGFSFFKAQLTIAKHFRMMYKAARENNRNGVAYMSYRDFKNTQRLEKEYRSKVTVV
ncbi:MAG: hypothetical protein H7Y86_07435 [Rhizobacter sp.]|nr:hypothetical protein [Ferruginibacter sp.]